MDQFQENGKCIIFSAPSGAGKTTIVRHLLKQQYGLEFSVSATSREARGDETHGKDYYFLSVADFRNNIAHNAFLEWEEVYTDQYYGTLRSEVERIWKAGKHVIFDVDVVGGVNLKRSFGDRALAVFVQPPSVDHLEQRLANRKTDSPESIAKRIAKANEEMSYSESFDTVLVNDNLDEAFAAAENLVGQFLSVMTE